MMDQDAIERRERIFTKLRESQTECDELSNRYDELTVQIEDISSTLTTKRKENEILVRLIKTMIMYDCCPVEAQLQYSDEIEDDDKEAAVSGMGYSGGYQGYPTRKVNMQNGWRVSKASGQGGDIDDTYSHRKRKKLRATLGWE